MCAYNQAPSLWPLLAEGMVQHKEFQFLAHKPRKHHLLHRNQMQHFIHPLPGVTQGYQH